MRASFGRSRSPDAQAKKQPEPKAKTFAERRAPLNEQEEFDKVADDFLGRQKLRLAQRKSTKGRQSPTVDLEYFLQADTTGHQQKEDGLLGERPDFIDEIPEAPQLSFKPKNSDIPRRQ